MNKIDFVKDIIRKSSYLVCLQGVQTSHECGCSGYRDQDVIYEVEEKYGYAPEEMFNASFYNTRIDQFYQYYRNEVIRDLGEVGPAVQALKTLEDHGYLKAIVTREVFHLAVRAGCKEVEELHGNVYHYFCPHCRTQYTLQDIQNTKGVPHCKKCNTVIRPGVVLVGEMVENEVLTKAATQVSHADVLLIAGCNMKNRLATDMVKYFKGDKIILINEQEHYADNLADVVIHGKSMDILPQLVV